MVTITLAPRTWKAGRSGRQSLGCSEGGAPLPGFQFTACISRRDEGWPSSLVWPARSRSPPVSAANCFSNKKDSGAASHLHTGSHCPFLQCCLSPHFPNSAGLTPYHPPRIYLPGEPPESHRGSSGGSASCCSHRA